MSTPRRVQPKKVTIAAPVPIQGPILQPAEPEKPKLTPKQFFDKVEAIVNNASLSIGQKKQELTNVRLEAEREYGLGSDDYSQVEEALAWGYDTVEKDEGYEGSSLEGSQASESSQDTQPLSQPLSYYKKKVADLNKKANPPKSPPKSRSLLAMEKLAGESTQSKTQSLFSQVKDPIIEPSQPSSVRWKKKSNAALQQKQEQQEEEKAEEERLKQLAQKNKQKPFVYYRTPPQIIQDQPKPAPVAPVVKSEDEKALARKVLSLFNDRVEVLRDLFEIHKKTMKKADIIKAGLKL
jgi:hypothetical protein